MISPNDWVKARLQTSKNMLRLILDKLEMIYKDQPYLEYMFKAIFVTGYYGMVWVVELTESPHCLRVADVHRVTNKNKLQLVLRSSKMHNVGDVPQLIKISSLDQKAMKSVLDRDNYCPFNIIRLYEAIRE